MDTINSIISSLRRILNLLLPFTDPSTPLLQDIIHTLALCTALYFAPTILERRVQDHLRDYRHEDAIEPDPPFETNEEPLHPTAIEEIDGEDIQQEAAEPPPLAPTPPPLAHNPEPQVLLDDDEDAEEGPANQDRPRATPQNRVVGAKKAKSLAKRDQRRAYHEFMRQQGEARRAAEAEGAEEREALLAEEKRRRREAEEAMRERERAEREAKKEEERREQEAERLRRENVVRAVREGLDEKGCVDLGELAWKEGKDRVWVERVVRAGGIVGGKEVRGGVCAVITGGGWAVRVDREAMKEAYIRAMKVGGEGDGRISWGDLGNALESVFREQIA